MTDFDPKEFVRDRPNLKILLDLKRDDREIAVYFNADDGRYYALSYWSSNAPGPRVKLLPFTTEEEVAVWIGNVRQSFYTS